MFEDSRTLKPLTPLPHLFLAMVFIATGLLRLVHKTEREEERTKVFFLPKYSDYAIIFFEILAGILLLLNNKMILYYVLLFVIIACVSVIVFHYKAILSSTKDLLTFKPTATSLMLHLTYLFIIVYTIVGNV